MPPGGDGLYYFSVYLTMNSFDFGYFDIELNGETICTAYGDTYFSTFLDSATTSCSAVAAVTEGKKLKFWYDKLLGLQFTVCSVASLLVIVYGIEGDTVQVVLITSDDLTPLATSNAYYLNGFTGFRIWVTVLV